MSFPRYPKYKPSGVEWLGEVPDKWAVTPLKYTVRIRSGGTPSKDREDYWNGDIPWASSKDMKVDQLLDTEDHITTAAIAEGAAETVDPGTILVVTRGMILAHSFPVATVRVPMAVNQDLKALTPNAELDGSFVAWLLRGAKAESLRRTDESAHGTKVLRMSDWAAIPIVVPPLPEQRAIAAFLDRETAKIDALVAEQERLIELLAEKRQAVISHAVTKGLDPAAPMKPSGVEWLGDVPAHWPLVPVYARYQQALGKMLDIGKATGLHPTRYLRNIDVRWDRIDDSDLPLMDITPEEVDRFTVRNGDLLLVEGRELGRCAVWNGADNVVGFQKALHRLRPLDATENTRFFYYTMIFANRVGIFFADQTPNEIPHLTGEQLRAHRFPKPPIKEQTAIVEFLDRQAGSLAELAEEAKRTVTLLQERRSALISAAVTGQIDVRKVATVGAS